MSHHVRKLACKNSDPTVADEFASANQDEIILQVVIKVIKVTE